MGQKARPPNGFFEVSGPIVSAVNAVKPRARARIPGPQITQWTYSAAMGEGGDTSEPP